MDKTITWQLSAFEELTADALYAILHLRGRVFVVEQDCAYLDADCKDQAALHLHGYIDGRLMAYCRLFEAGRYFREAAIGRVIVAQEYRKRGYGHALMRKALEVMADTFSRTAVTISAQEYLKAFYEGHGFVQTGEMYLEDGIPHVEMRRS